jgi:glycosyltransferase involved in cell wall biosynthesis
MMTNTFTPHVGGVARSVASFAEEYRRLGHKVLVVAPTFEAMPLDESDVIRAPAIQNFNGSNFSVPLPIPGMLSATLAKANQFNERGQPYSARSIRAMLRGPQK